jgi:hypothetical protein
MSASYCPIHKDWLAYNGISGSNVKARVFHFACVWVGVIPGWNALLRGGAQACDFFVVLRVPLYEVVVSGVT